MTTISEFITVLVDRYAGELEPIQREFILGDFEAGEFDAAAIMMIEDGPVSAADVDEFERLLPQLAHLDRKIAQRVIAKRRSPSQQL